VREDKGEVQACEVGEIWLFNILNECCGVSENSKNEPSSDDIINSFLSSEMRMDLFPAPRISSGSWFRLFLLAVFPTPPLEPNCMDESPEAGES
jgi:hypothetical protein